MDALLPTDVNAIRVALDAGTSGAWAVAVRVRGVRGVRGFVRSPSHVCFHSHIEASIPITGSDRHGRIWPHESGSTRASGKGVYPR